ncbi:hypothetical protein BJX96DRAFT_145322, partial [Aspergillus floccosus]
MAIPPFYFRSFVCFNQPEPAASYWKPGAPHQPGRLPGPSPARTAISSLPWE